MTALAVELCGCGHAERMHERDSGAEHDRGVCMQRSCGCSEYRPGVVEAVAAAAVDDLLPISAAAPAPAVAPSAYESLAARLLPCPVDGCDRRFESPQGVTMHRRRAHEGYQPNSKPDAGSPSPVPEQATDGPREVTAAFAPELAAVPQSGRDTEDRGDPHRGLTDAAIVEEPTYGLVDVAPDDFLLGLVQALDRIQTAEPAALLEQAFAIRDYFAEASWAVVQSGPVT